MRKKSVAFYNLENLFDTTDDKFIDDDDFTPDGKKRWTEHRYENKIRKLGFAISQIGLEETQDFPSLIGLSEVENKHVIQDLINSDALSNERFGIVHFESMDERGIDNALIYQKNEFLPLHSEPIRFTFENKDGTTDYTRDVLYVNGQFGVELLHIFILHFPSKRNKDINKPKRKEIAEQVYRRIQEIHKKEDAPHIIVMGDFNENPTDKNLKEALNTHSEPAQLLIQDLYNPMEELFKQNKGSLMHDGKWLLFDQILFSKAFFYQKSSIKLKSTHIFDEKFLQNWDERYGGEPYRTYIGKKYLNGYSDHFPVYAILELTK